MNMISYSIHLNSSEGMKHIFIKGTKAELKEKIYPLIGLYLEAFFCATFSPSSPSSQRQECQVPPQGYQLPPQLHSLW